MRPRILSALLCLTLATTVFGTDFSTRFNEIRAKATPQQLYTFLYALPKGGDLHNHAGGSNRAEWLLAVLTDPARNGGDHFYTRIKFNAQPDAISPTVRYRTIRQRSYKLLSPAAQAEYAPLASLTADERAAWCNALRLDAPGEGRDEFFQVIWARFGDLGHNPHVRIEMLAENIKAFSAEGLRYLETQFDLEGFYDNDGHRLSDEASLTLLHERFAQPDLAPIFAAGFVVRFQFAILRFAPNAEATLKRSYAWVAAHRDLWVGLNMVGIEERGPGYPKRFLDTFRELRRTYPSLPLSIHAGEMDGPDNHIRDTLLLGASRIGHGVNLIKDPDTLLLLQQTRRVLVEINLISNRLLEYVPDLSTHPFPEYLRTGVPVCLNTDDRGMWDSNLTDEYYTAVTTFNLSWDEIVKLGRNSLTYSFAQPEVKAKLLADYEQRVAAFEQQFAAGDFTETLKTIKPVTYGYARRTWGFAFQP